MSIEINCKDQRVEDIMRDVKEKSESVIYGGWHVVIGKSNDPIMEFTNLDSLNEEEQYKLFENLDVMITHLQLAVNSNFGVLPIFEAKIPTMRKLNVVKSLYDQVVNVLQKKENDKKLLEEEYFKKTNEELTHLLISLDFERNVNGLFSKKDIDDINAKINIINIILAHRELEESKHIDEIRNEKWNRYNNLEVEELEMILDALNVRCNLYRFENKYKCEAIQKAKEDVLENMKVIKDILKCKKGVK